MDGKEVNPFASVRVAGIVDRTDIRTGNQNPTWETNFKFPIFLPILNDKIIIRVWDKKGAGSDRLIGSIPEIPAYSDVFNITTLLSIGGNIPSRWYNMYSHPLDEQTTSKGLKNLVGLAKKSYAGS
jgi:hypothetical protein